MLYDHEDLWMKYVMGCCLYMERRTLDFQLTTAKVFIVTIDLIKSYTTASTVPISFEGLRRFYFHQLLTFVSSNENSIHTRSTFHLSPRDRDVKQDMYVYIPRFPRSVSTASKPYNSRRSRSVPSPKSPIMSPTCLSLRLIITHGSLSLSLRVSHSHCKVVASASFRGQVFLSVHLV